MDNVLTVSHPTPLRNIRQILAEINKTKAGLQESYFNAKETEVKIKKLKRKLDKEVDELEIELLEIKVQKKQAQLYNIQELQKSAIRKINNYITQIKAIKEKHNLENFDELDFEKEEEKYHIMKAFSQAINAARSRHGKVDEGNQIYFQQIGINGQLAEKYINELFEQERIIIENGNIPSADFIDSFLDNMYNIFKGCTDDVYIRKGMLKDESSLLIKEE